MSDNEFENQLAEILKKLRELLHCGNERVELAAAKELLNLTESELMKKDADDAIEVNIRVVKQGE